MRVSRFETQAGVYHFGRIRRTDWFLVGGRGEPQEQLERGDESEASPEGSDDDSSEYACRAGDGHDAGLIAPCGGNASDEELDVRSVTGSCGYDSECDHDLERAQDVCL